MAPKPRSRWKSSALGVFAGSASVRVSAGDPDPVAQLLQQRRAGGQRHAALLVWQRHRHLGDPREGLDQLELVRGQVVEPVEEDRPPPPELAGAAQQRDRLAGDPVRVDPAEPLPRLLVAREQGGEVAQVGGALQRPGSGLDRLGPQPGRLQLVEQALEGDREAGARGRAPQRPQPLPPLLDRDRDGPAPLRRASAPRPAASRPRSPPPGTAPGRSSRRRRAPRPPRTAPARRRRRRPRWARLGPGRGRARPRSGGGPGRRDPSWEARGSGSEAPLPAYARPRRAPPQTARSPPHFAVYRPL